MLTTHAVLHTVLGTRGTWADRVKSLPVGKVSCKIVRYMQESYLQGAVRTEDVESGFAWGMKGGDNWALKME